MQAPGSPFDAGVRDRLVEAARLAAMGRLLPSLVHQLSTPLASIALRAESLGKSREEVLRASERVERYLDAIAADAGRCKELLAVIRDFARPAGDERQPVDLNAVCRGAARLVLHEGMRRQVAVQLELAEDLPPVAGQEVPIRGAVLGIVLNAVDASPVGGCVTIETRALPDGVAVSVSDEGEGIPDGDRPRLFEPFFSTRPRGVGLGLMACRAVAEAHGGSVEVDTQPGRGSRFTLRLPNSPGGARGEGDAARA